MCPGPQRCTARKFHRLRISRNNRVPPEARMRCKDFCTGLLWGGGVTETGKGGGNQPKGGGKKRWNERSDPGDDCG